MKSPNVFCVFLFITGMFFFSGVKGQGQLENYLRIAAEKNPGLKAAFNDYLAAMEGVAQVGTLPDPELTIGFFLKPMDRFMGQQQADIQLMQMFPWFGTLRAREDEASKMALARYEAFEEQKNALFYQVKTTWYELYRLSEEIRITERNLDILRKYERLALIRFQSPGTGPVQPMQNRPMEEESSQRGGMGNMGNKPARQQNAPMKTSPAMDAPGRGMSDVLRVKMELKELENNLILLKESLIPLKAQFNQLLNRDSNDPVEIADTLRAIDLPMARQALLDSIKQNNPMIKMLEAEKGAYEVQQRMARLEGRPMLGAGINYMPFGPRTEGGMTMGGEDMVMPMIKLSLPIFRKKYNAMEKEAELKQQAASQRKANALNQLTTEWSMGLRDFDDAVRRAVLYKEQTVLANQTLNLLMTGYSTSGRDFEEVLRVQQRLLDYELKLITAIVDQHMSMARLEAMY